MPGDRKQLVRSTLGAQIVDDLRTEILYGSLPAGTLLSQRELCERYGTSRMPVRDALRQLTHEGFVDADGTGRVVVALDDRDVEDANAIAALLHGFAARLAAERAGPSDVTELVKTNDAMKASYADGDLVGVARYNWFFHRQINILAGSVTLRAAIRLAASRTPQDFSVRFPDTVARSLREHDAIVSALRARNVALAERLAREHVHAANVSFTAERHGRRPDGLRR